MLDSPYLEVHADSGQKCLVEDVVGEPHEEAGLTNCWVVYEEDLKHEVVFWSGHSSIENEYYSIPYVNISINKKWKIMSLMIYDDY